MRLIDADAFYEELEKLKRHADNEFAGAIALTQVRIAIRPTVDAEPVRHGHWVHLGGDEWCCSNCGEVIFTEGSWEKPTDKYCNNCGAKMDLEVSQ